MFANLIRSMYLALVQSGNIVYTEQAAPVKVTAGKAAAKVAMLLILADAGLPVWWFCGFTVNTHSVTGLYQWTWGWPATGANVIISNLMVEHQVVGAAGYTNITPIILPRPIRIPALSGCAAQVDTVGAGETVSTAPIRATGIGA